MARIEVSKTSEEISREIWRDAEAVCFDVDSTVIRIEGIDELASFLGVAEEVKAWYACVSFMQKGTCVVASKCPPSLLQDSACHGGRCPISGRLEGSSGHLQAVQGEGEYLDCTIDRLCSILYRW